jgi:hypothetical protein
MSSTPYWLDADTACAVTNPATGSTATERWSTQKGCVVSAGRIITFDYYNQYLLNVNGGSLVTLSVYQYGVVTSVSGPNWADAGTTARASSSGVWGRSGGAGQRVASWNIDGGTSTTVSTTGTVTTSLITMSATHTVNFIAVSQYQVSLDAGGTTMLGSLTKPTITGDNYWYDTGTAVTLVLNGTKDRTAGAGLRLATYTINTGPAVNVLILGKVTVLNAISISQGENVVTIVVNQYQLTLDAGATTAMNSITPPTVAGDTYWYDSGTLVSYAGNGVFGRASGTGSRISSFTVDAASPTHVLTTGIFFVNMTMASAHTVQTTLVTQYEVSLSGGYLIQSATSPTVPSDDYWYDGGTNVTISLAGVFQRVSGAGQRLATYSVNGGTAVKVASAGAVAVVNKVKIEAPVAIAATSTQQFQVSLNAGAVAALNSITPPTLTGDAYWYDLGSKVTVILNGTWGRNATTGERLVSYSYNGGSANPVATLKTVTALLVTSITTPESVSATVTTQYLLTVTGVPTASYSPKPPISTDATWFDSGTSVKVSTNSTFGTSGSTRQRVTGWNLDGGATTMAGSGAVVSTSAFAMKGPHTVTFTVVTQYFVSVAVKDSSGVQALSPGSITLLVNGAAQNAPKGSVWVDSGSTVQVQTILWDGIDVTPSQLASRTVTAPLTVTVDAKAYKSSVLVKDFLGFGVGGAVVTVIFPNGTSDQFLTQGNGSANIGIVPLGEYHGSVSNFGLSNDFIGNSATQSVTQVTVYMSDSVLGTIVIVVVAVVIVVVELVHRRREGEKSSRFRQASVSPPAMG